MKRYRIAVSLIWFIIVFIVVRSLVNPEIEDLSLFWQYWALGGIPAFVLNILIDLREKLE